MAYGKPYALAVVDDAAPDPIPLPPVGSRRLLLPSDFAYVGYYDIQTDGADTVYGQGFTHRYVNGELRFLTLSLKSVLHEISMKGISLGGKITKPVRTWSGLGGLKNFSGLWWEEAKQRLWSVAATDYTATIVPTQIFTRQLNNDGTVSNIRGPISLQGVNAKRVYGGVQPVPAWFQQQYGVGPYVVGWGGYTSLVNQGGGASIGPTMYAIPEPSAFASGAEMPSSAFTTIMDYAPAGSFRGRRVTTPINYYDGGDPRQNPSSPPTAPPATTAKWLSPAPDGLGYMVWGDSYWNTGCWIDTPTAHGFLAIASLGGGKCFYASSTLHSEKQQYELHLFDPADLGAAAQTRVKPSAVRPYAMQELTLPGLGAGKSGNGPTKNVAGATFDPISQRLYVLGAWTDKTINRLYVFKVNG